VSPTWKDGGRFVADRIPGARLEDLPGRDSQLWVGDQAATFRAVDGFLAQVRQEEAQLDSVLATVLFTDIVGSTEHAAKIGNDAWRSTLERHHSSVRAMLARYRGTEVDAV